MRGTGLAALPGRRALLWTGSVTAIVLVGFSRVYLGVHYPSDILAGWTLAIAWATTLSLATLGWTHDTHDHHDRPSSAGTAHPPPHNPDYTEINNGGPHA